MKLVLRVMDGPRAGTTREFSPSVVRLGRDPANDMVVGDPATDEVSRTHAQARFANAAWSLSDLGSTNGTYVNGRRVTDAVLQDGDEIGFGKRGPKLSVRLDPAAALAEVGAPDSSIARPPARTSMWLTLLAVLLAMGGTWWFIGRYTPSGPTPGPQGYIPDPVKTGDSAVDNANQVVHRLDEEAATIWFKLFPTDPLPSHNGGKIYAAALSKLDRLHPDHPLRQYAAEIKQLLDQYVKQIHALQESVGTGPPTAGGSAEPAPGEGATTASPTTACATPGPAKTSEGYIPDPVLPQGEFLANVSRRVLHNLAEDAAEQWVRLFPCDALPSHDAGEIYANALTRLDQLPPDDPRREARAGIKELLDRYNAMIQNMAR
jgi:hypothetical protein